MELLSDEPSQSPDKQVSKLVGSVSLLPVEDENIWLMQKMMAELGDNYPEIPDSSRQVNRQIKHYNLQMIIAIRFKVNNDLGVQIRK